MPTFQIFPSSGQFWFRLRADNGEIVLSSEGYTAQARNHGLSVVLTEAPKAPIEDLTPAAR